MKKSIIKFIFFLTILVSCNQKISKETKTSLINPSTTEIEEKIEENLKAFKLEHDFWVNVGQEEDFGKFKTYTFFKLTKNNKTIIVDSSLTEYEFGNKLFPITIKTEENSFELLFEINDRPHKNYLKRFFIKDNKLIRQDKLPTFVSKPIDINKDGIKEYAGFWDNPQIWGENNNLTAYNPILYYSVTKTGLKLDSLLTKQRNEKIYGKFQGFLFNENYEHPISAIEEFEKEIKLIKGN